MSDLEVQAARPWTQATRPPAIIQAFQLLMTHNNIVEIHPYPLHNYLPPWEESSCFQTFMADEPVTEMSDRAVQQLFGHKTNLDYSHCRHIYTDGSKRISADGEVAVAAAMVVPSANFVDSWKLPNILSIMSAELFAIWMALQWVEAQPDNGIYALFTDSLSSIMLLQNESHSSRGVYKALIMPIVARLNSNQQRVTILWIPSHRGILGNEAVDKVAKEATRLQIITIPHLTRMDGRALFEQWLHNKWKSLWEETVQAGRAGLHIAHVKQSIGHWPWASIPGNRRLETALARLRIGHSGLRANLFRFGLYWSPLCDCGQVETVAHMLLSCTLHQPQRGVFRTKLQALRVPFTFCNILGGGPFPILVQRKVILALEEFLATSNKINVV